MFKFNHSLVAFSVAVLIIGVVTLVCPSNSYGQEAPAAETAQIIRDGVSLGGPRVETATPGFINFDPPSLFMNTQPLQTAPYMNPSTKAYFIRGEGAVLNQGSNFGVTGHSAPNFLAWNCSATNSDGTKPALPAEIKFLETVSTVSIRVGSSGNAGSIARLIAFNSQFNQVATSSVTLGSALQTLTVNRPGVIRYVRLTGPCAMVADDLTVTP